MADPAPFESAVSGEGDDGRVKSTNDLLAQTDPSPSGAAVEGSVKKKRSKPKKNILKVKLPVLQTSCASNGSTTTPKRLKPLKKLFNNLRKVIPGTRCNLSEASVLRLANEYITFLKKKAPGEVDTLYLQSLKSIKASSPSKLLPG